MALNWSVKDYIFVQIQLLQNKILFKNSRFKFYKYLQNLEIWIKSLSQFVLPVLQDRSRTLLYRSFLKAMCLVKDLSI